MDLPQLDVQINPGGPLGTPLVALTLDGAPLERQWLYALFYGLAPGTTSVRIPHRPAWVIRRYGPAALFVPQTDPQPEAVSQEPPVLCTLSSLQSAIATIRTWDRFFDLDVPEATQPELLRLWLSRSELSFAMAQASSRFICATLLHEAARARPAVLELIDDLAAGRQIFGELIDIAGCPRIEAHWSQDGAAQVWEPCALVEDELVCALTESVGLRVRAQR